MARKHRPHTPDGRYLVSRGVLKRCTNPSLEDSFRRAQLKALVQARMHNDSEAVLAAKIALGEAGPMWWDDGTEDLSGSKPEATQYGQWWNELSDEERVAGAADKKSMFKKG